MYLLLCSTEGKHVENIQALNVIEMYAGLGINSVLEIRFVKRCMCPIAVILKFYF